MARQLHLQGMGRQVDEGMVLAIDPGDLNRDNVTKIELPGASPAARQRRNRERLSAAECGYTDLKQGHTLPLVARLLPAERAGLRSENFGLLHAMEQVQRHVQGKPPWVMTVVAIGGRYWRRGSRLVGGCWSVSTTSAIGPSAGASTSTSKSSANCRSSTRTCCAVAIPRSCASAS